MDKISIYGVFPPPYGGVSVHIKRLSSRLLSINRLEKVYNFGIPSSSRRMFKAFDYVESICVSTRFDLVGYLFWIVRYGFTDDSRIMHFHNNLNGSFLILAMKYLFKKKIIITIHDQMYLERPVKWYRKWYVVPFLCCLFRQKDVFWIAVNDNIKNQLCSNGVPSHMVSVIPAFIKEAHTTPSVFNKVSHDFISNHSPILSVYSMCTRLEKNQDLYGVDLCLQLISKLKEYHPNIGLIICIPGNKCGSMMSGYEKYIRECHLDDHVLWLKDSFDDTSRLWRISDVFLRPTNTDGDSMCVREALQVKTIVLASDVVKRPEGTVLFKNRDIDDFIKSALFILENIESLKSKIPQDEDKFFELYALYNDCIKP